MPLSDGHSGDYLSISFHLPSAVNTRKKMKTEERKICLDYQEPMNTLYVPTGMHVCNLIQVFPWASHWGLEWFED